MCRWLLPRRRKRSPPRKPPQTTDKLTTTKTTTPSPSPPHANTNPDLSDNQPAIPPHANTNLDLSENQPPTPSFPDGVMVLHDCPDATVDICFVHGLTGDRESTWTARGQSAPWPKSLLPQRLSGGVRVLTYGYDAYIVRRGVAGSNRLIDHATNLLHDLAIDRSSSNASARPLIFVAHSLGGLVCKKAVLLARNNPEAYLAGIFDCVKGIVFLGTPHKGSWMADWAKIPASAVGLVKSTNKSLLKILETEDQFLESIQVDFGSMVRGLRERGRGFEITCFFEELPLPGFGKVVSKESATFEGFAPISIHANHSDMVRFGSAEENGFKRVLGVLSRWIPEAGNLRDEPPADTVPRTFAPSATVEGGHRVASVDHSGPSTQNTHSIPTGSGGKRVAQDHTMNQDFCKEH